MWVHVYGGSQKEVEGRSEGGGVVTKARVSEAVWCDRPVLCPILVVVTRSYVCELKLLTLYTKSTLFSKSCFFAKKAGGSLELCSGKWTVGE